MTVASLRLAPVGGNEVPHGPFFISLTALGMASARPSPGARRVSRTRGALGVGAVILADGLGAWLSTGPTGCPRPRRQRRQLRHSPGCGSSSRGFTVREMRDRVAAVGKIAIRATRRDAAPDEEWALAAVAKAKPPPAFRRDWAGKRLEGFLFPALYEFSQYTTGREPHRRSAGRLRRQWARIDLRYARSKNLTPYDVLVIASMIEEETVAPEERRLVAAVIYNRLRRRMPLQIDATTRYGARPPGHQIAPQVRPQVGQPFLTAQAAGAAANADHESASPP